MHAMTVLGPIDINSMGITLPHEHLFIDLRNQFTEFSDPEKKRVSHEPVEIHNLGRLKSNPYGLKDNLVIEDMAVVLDEVSAFKKLGGKTIVECTSVGIKRDARKLKDLSLRSGVNIIAGSGYYTQDTHPKDMDSKSAEDIAKEIVSDLTVGIDGTDIKAGVIGELGTSEPFHPNEEKNLLAAAIAFKATGVPIYVHVYPWGTGGLKALSLLLENGVDPRKVVICHSDVEPNIEYMKALLEKKVYLEFDNFGKEFYLDPSERGFAGGIFIRDIERVRLIKRFVEWGFAKQLLITNDICIKTMLLAYGGWGYGHILRNIVPMMLDEGLFQEEVDLIVRENPQAVFS